MPGPQRNPISPLVWIGILLAGSVLRLIGLDAESLWVDEGFTLHSATAPDIWHELGKEGNPPLFFLMLRGWIELVGLQPAALRLMPAIASVLALWLLAAGLRAARLPGTTATLTLAIYAGSPFLCWYAHELRPYSFLELGTVAMFSGWQFARRERFGLGLLVAAPGAAFACGSHYFGVMAAVAATLLAWLEPPPGRSRWLLPLAIVAAALTAVPVYATLLPVQMDHDWGPQSHLSPGYVASLPLRLFVAQGGELPKLIVAAVAVVIGGLALVTVANLWRRATSGWWRTVAIGVLLPLAGVLAANVVVEPRFTARYFIMAALYLYLFCGLAAATWPALRTNVIAVVVLVVFGVTTVASLQLQANDGFREACASVRQHWQNGDRIGTVTATPLGYCSGALPAYLTPEMLAGGFDNSYEPRARTTGSEGGRLHLVVRWMPYTEKRLRQLEQILPIQHRSPIHNRVEHWLVEWP